MSPTDETPPSPSGNKRERISAFHLGRLVAVAGGVRPGPAGPDRGVRSLHRRLRRIAAREQARAQRNACRGGSEPPPEQ